MNFDAAKNSQEYYGKTLQGTEDLKTTACCTATEPPAHIKAAMVEIHEEVSSRYYGCGLVIPPSLEGAKVIDLGSGSGRDCYILSKLVGPKGWVTGVDMTLEQLAVANRHIEFHQKAFDHPEPNIEFLEGNIEKLGELNLGQGTYDIAVSNCVVNLAEDKEKVFSGLFELLKEGGELYFSDVYSTKRIPKDLAEDPLLHGECLGGALYWNDFIAMAKKLGFSDPRLVESKEIEVEDKELKTMLGEIRFFSATMRLVKLKDLEPDCEDYGQTVCYRGGIEGSAEVYHMDEDHAFHKGKIEPVCGNSYLMLQKTRFAKYFDFSGSFDRHQGVFPGFGDSIPLKNTKESNDSGCC